MPEQVALQRGPSQRQRAATATQNARSAQWHDDNLQKAKHLRNASEMTSMTFTVDADNLVAAQHNSAPSIDRLPLSSRHMASSNDDGSVARKANNPASSKAPMEARLLEDLVDRLLDRPCGEADHKFITTFLCLYRKFAAPSEVISSILQKFAELGNNHEIPHLTRIATQLRALALLVRWINEYPGDFAHPTTSLSLTDFAKSISQTHEFAFSSRELLSNLENLKPDEDTEWACSDKGRGRASTTASFASVPSLRISLPSSMGNLTLVSSHDSTGSIGGSTEDLVRHRKPGSGHSASSSITSSFMDREPSMSGSTLTLNNPFEVAQRQVAALMRPSKQPLNKTHWHEFMNIEDDVIAKELTRIDWALFSSIRPRDLIRHINGSGEARNTTKGLETIDKMVAHFNHVASWLGQLILLRDKPKHRARMLEKCMSIAWILRQMKNYNGVGAFVAGLSNTSIARLHQTKALVDSAIAKNFMSLEILMGTGKGYFAYRLAWDNTTGSKIPFLPLHRHDLVVAEETNPTFADSDKTMINWTKFDVMGRSLWDIHKSQRGGFIGLNKSADVMALVMQGKEGEDVEDMLYDRSLQVEPAANRESVGRRSGWLRTS